MDREQGIIDTFTELSSKYESTVDSEIGRFWGWRYEDFIDHLIKLTPLQQTDYVLDVATGTALIPRKLFRLVEKIRPIHGLDITLAMLKKAKGKILEESLPNHFCLVCASAMAMPYVNSKFDVVFCGFATHHMDVPNMLSEMSRVLRNNGNLTIADVGGSPWFNIPGIKFLFKIAAFIYFSFQENLMRAWAEADAVSNYRSIEEWYDLLNHTGYKVLKITQLQSRYFWIPKILLIQAMKNTAGEVNESN